MRREVVTCDRCGKEFESKIDRGNYFIHKDICEECYDKFLHFLSKPSETVPDSVEEAFNSICEKLTGLEREEVMRILDKLKETYSTEKE